MTNYYEDKINEINNLKKSDLSKALSVLMEELKMPYIPQKYEKTFNDLYKEIRTLSSEKKIPYAQMNHENVLAFLNASEYEKNAIAIDNLKNINLHKIVKELQKWIKQKELDPNYFLHIALIYENLVEQNIDQDFSIKKQKVNPSRNGSIFNNQEVKKAFSSLLNCFEKEPNLQNVVIGEMEIYLLKMFPIFPRNGVILAKQFVNVIHFLFKKNIKLSIQEKKILEICKFHR